MIFILSTVDRHLNHCHYYSWLFISFLKMSLFLVTTIDWRTDQVNCSPQNAGEKNLEVQLTEHPSL